MTDPLAFASLLARNEINATSTPAAIKKTAIRSTVFKRRPKPSLSIRYISFIVRHPSTGLIPQPDAGFLN